MYQTQKKKLDVILPDQENDDLAQELAQMVQELGSFYYCPAVNLATLLEVEFMNSYIRKGSLPLPLYQRNELTPMKLTGSLIALSIDQVGGDTICIDGRGKSQFLDSHRLPLRN
jgi:hypothetical protein